MIAAALLIAAWINKAAGPAIVATLSALVLVWCFFQAPVTCAAPVRGRTDGCRNNATGLLMGCHIRQHRWQKLKMLILRRQVREFCSGLFSEAVVFPRVTGAFPLVRCRCGVSAAGTGVVSS
ncbi:hypothetical protein AB0L17_04690, partial [Streptomyces cellulosae]